MRHWLTLAVVLQGLSGGHATLAQDGAQAKSKTGSRWALLVGVDDYAEAQKLHFCGADMLALRDHLISAGFPEQQVIVLHDKAQETKYRPTKHNVQRQLELMLGLVAKDDLLVVGFSGHGIQIRGKSYLCPADTELNVADSMVPLDCVYDQLDHCPAALKLVLVDACRNDPRQAGQKGVLPSEGVKQFAASLERPPKGILMLTSCAPGQISMEDQAFGHGVFMHFLLEGMEGKADAEGKGRVSLLDLCKYANRETKSYVLRKFNGTQTPALKGDLNDDFDIESGPNLSALLDKAEMALTHVGGRGHGPMWTSIACYRALLGEKERAAAMFAEGLSTFTNPEFVVGSEIAAGLIDDAQKTMRQIPPERARWILPELAVAQARAGRTEDAKATLAEAVRDDTPGFGNALQIAHVQISLGLSQQLSDIVRLINSYTERNESGKPDMMREAHNAMVIATIARMQMQTGHQKEALATLSVARRIALRVDKERAIYDLPNVMAAFARAGDKQTAQELVARCLQFAREEKYTWARAWQIRRVAQMQAYLGDKEAALATLDEALQAVPLINDWDRKEEVMGPIAVTLWRWGDRQKATRILQEALSLRVRKHNYNDSPVLWCGLSNCQVEMGELAAAVEDIESLTSVRSEKDRSESLAFVIRGALICYSEDRTTYPTYLQEAARLIPRIKNIEVRAGSLLNLADLQFSIGQLEAAKASYEQARTLAAGTAAEREVRNNNILTAILYKEIDKHIREGRFREAVKVAEEEGDQEHLAVGYLTIVGGFLKQRGVSRFNARDHMVKFDYFDAEYGKWITTLYTR